MATIDIQQLKKYSLADSSLRDYQQENKQKIYDAWGKTNSVMLQMPTGTGNTRLCVSIIKDIFHYGHDKKTSAVRQMSMIVFCVFRSNPLLWGRGYI